MDEKTFTIKVTMRPRWIPYFLAFLRNMEHNGAIGHSEKIGFYSDGDGDFRPRFEFPKEFKNESLIPYKNYSCINNKPIGIAHFYDAG